MSIYLLSVEPEGFKELTLPEGESFIAHDCAKWNGAEKAADWSTPKVVWLDDEFSQATDVDADLVKFGGAMVVTKNAREALTALVGEQVEFLPVILESGETRYILNVVNVQDVMDKARSKYKIYSDGNVGMCEHAYINTPTPEQTIYKVKGFLGRTFINETAFFHIQESGMTGMLIRAYKNP